MDSVASRHGPVDALRPAPVRLHALRWLRERFELLRGGDTNLRPMEGLRGFAVFLVFLVHYVTFADPWIPLRGPMRTVTTAVLHAGTVGVDLFFVLSGFLIYGGLMRRAQPLGQFLVRRVQRIYPAFLAVFAVYVTLSLSMPAESRIPPTPAAAARFLIANLLLLPGLWPIRPLITVAWSLSFEMAFYLATPVLVALSGLRHWSSSGRTCAFVAAAGAIATACAIWGGPVRLIMFLSGMALYEVMQLRLAHPPPSAMALGALSLGLAVAALLADGPAPDAMRAGSLFVSLFVFCYGCFAQPTSVAARLFTLTPVRWLGNMSYSYYLIHGLTLNAAFRLVRDTIGEGGDPRPMLVVGLVAPMFALTLLPSAALYLAVERRFSLRSGAPVPR